MKKSIDLQTNDHYRSTYYRSHRNGKPMQTPNMNAPAKTRRYRIREYSISWWACFALAIHALILWAGIWFTIFNTINFN